MTRKSESVRPIEVGAAEHVFDQTNGALGFDDASPDRTARGAGSSGDVPAATNLLFGGQ